MITNTITDIVIGPCDRNMLNSQPTIGRSTRTSGGSNESNVPALPLGRMRRFR